MSTVLTHLQAASSKPCHFSRGETKPGEDWEHFPLGVSHWDGHIHLQFPYPGQGQDTVGASPGPTPRLRQVWEVSPHFAPVRAPGERDRKMLQAGNANFCLLLLLRQKKKIEKSSGFFYFLDNVSCAECLEVLPAVPTASLSPSTFSCLLSR